MACNKVEAVVVQQKYEKQKKQYSSYSSQEQVDVGNHAAEHGPRATLQHFTKLQEHSVVESTAHKLWDLYCERLECS